MAGRPDQRGLLARQPFARQRVDGNRAVDCSAGGNELRWRPLFGGQPAAALATDSVTNRGTAADANRAADRIAFGLTNSNGARTVKRAISIGHPQGDAPILLFENVLAGHQGQKQSSAAGNGLRFLFPRSTRNGQFVAVVIRGEQITAHNIRNRCGIRCNARGLLQAATLRPLTRPKQCDIVDKLHQAQCTASISLE